MRVIFPAVAFLFFLGGHAAPATPEANATDTQASPSTGGSPADCDPYAGLPYKYVGNSFSCKFHRPSCPFARAMSPAHLCFFHFRKQAIEAGQVPCRYCLPPDWKTVGAVILPPGVEKR